MKQKFHTFTAAPLFTSAEPIKMPKYKAGDTIYLDVGGDKYILTVSSYKESENSVWRSSHKFKLEGDKNWTEGSGGFFYLDSRHGGSRTIHPSLESLEGLGPVKVGDTVYLTLNKTQFIVNVDKIEKTDVFYGSVFYGSYIAKEVNQNWTKRMRGIFWVDEGYKRHASQQEMEQAAKNA